MNNVQQIISLPIPNIFIWILFFMILIIFLIKSFAFVYHWRYYGVEGNHRVFAKSLYFIVGIALLIAMFVTGFYYVNVGTSTIPSPVTV